MSLSKREMKELLGSLPITADFYLHLIQRGKPLNRASSLERLQQALPQWKRGIAQVLQNPQQWQDTPKKVTMLPTAYGCNMLPCWG